MDKAPMVTRMRPWLAALAWSVVAVGCGGGGDDVTTLPDRIYTSPAKLSTTLAFDKVGVGYSHACMLTSTGDAWCWGSNEFGKLGTAAAVPSCSGGTIPCSYLPRQVQGGLQFTAIDGSTRHTCALTAAGDAWCWGFGQGGQLGNGANVDSAAPVAVAGGLHFTQLDAGIGGLVTCGIATDTFTYCWGPGNSGGLGNGSTIGSNVPVAVQFPVPFTRVAVGEDHACALDTAGNAYCWGRNGFGKLGKGVSGASLTPVAVVGGLVFKDIAVGGWHSCALALDGTPYCWGLGLSGSAKSLTPVAMTGAPPLVSLSAGYERTCGLTATGAAYCWSAGFVLVGDGTRQPRDMPTAVAGGLLFRAISAGGVTCGLTMSNEPYCWGNNAHGAVGQPDVDP